MGGLCKEGHEFLRICKKKNLPATLRMMDVLATQHSKWTATRLRRALFGQSLVDFSADPWIGAKSSKKKAQPHVEMKSGKKASRIEREFSQSQSEFSQTPLVEEESSSDFESEEAPLGTVHYHKDPNDPQRVFSVQDFSAFQYHSSNLSNVTYSQEQEFSTSFPGTMAPNPL